MTRQTLNINKYAYLFELKRIYKLSIFPAPSWHAPCSFNRETEWRSKRCFIGPPFFLSLHSLPPYSLSVGLQVSPSRSRGCFSLAVLFSHRSASRRGVNVLFSTCSSRLY